MLPYTHAKHVREGDSKYNKLLRTHHPQRKQWAKHTSPSESDGNFNERTNEWSQPASEWATESGEWENIKARVIFPSFNWVPLRSISCIYILMKPNERMKENTHKHSLTSQKERLQVGRHSSNFCSASGFWNDKRFTWCAYDQKATVLIALMKNTRHVFISITVATANIFLSYSSTQPNLTKFHRPCRFENWVNLFCFNPITMSTGLFMCSEFHSVWRRGFRSVSAER